MTEEAPPEGLETKDVHTMSGGTFQGTEQGTPGYHPAAVPNRNETTINGDETVHEQGLRPQDGAAAGDGGEEKSSSSGGSKSTAAKSTSRTASKSS